MLFSKRYHKHIFCPRYKTLSRQFSVGYVRKNELRKKKYKAL